MVMGTIQVEITGTSPLLMNKIGVQAFESMSTKVRKVKTTMTPKEDAEDSAYRNKAGKLIVPERCIKACITNASSWYKMGRNSAKQFISGCVRVHPVEVSLGVSKYDIDSRPVVVQRARIIRHRPRLDEWKLKFTLIYNKNYLEGHEDTIRQIIEEAGVRVGLLDNRPHKGGGNGCFEITKWKVTK